MKRRSLKAGDFVLARCRVDDLFSPAIIIKIYKSPIIYEVEYLDRNDKAYVRAQHIKLFDQTTSKKYKEELREILNFTYDKQKINLLLQAAQITEQQIEKRTNRNFSKYSQQLEKDALINLNQSHLETDLDVFSIYDQPIPRSSVDYKNKDRVPYEIITRSQTRYCSKQKQLTLQSSFQKIKLKLKKKQKEETIFSEPLPTKKRKIIQNSQEKQLRINNQEQSLQQLTPNFIEATIDGVLNQQINNKQQNNLDEIQINRYPLQLQQFASNIVDKQIQNVQKNEIKGQQLIVEVQIDKQECQQSDEKQHKIQIIKQQQQIFLPQNQSLVIKQPQPAIQQLLIPVIEQPRGSVIIEQEQGPVVIEQPQGPVVEEIQIIAVQQLKITIREQPQLSVVKQAQISIIQQPQLSIIKQVLIPAVQQLQVSVVEQAQISVLEQSQISLAEQAEIPVREQAQIPIIEQIQIPIIEQAQITFIQQPQVPFVEQLQITALQNKAVNEQIQIIIAQASLQNNKTIDQPIDLDQQYVQNNKIKNPLYNIMRQQIVIQVQNADYFNLLNIYKEIDPPLNYDQLLRTLPLVQTMIGQYPKERYISFVRECLLTMIKFFKNQMNKQFILPFKQRQLLIAIMKNENLDLNEMLSAGIIKLMIKFQKIFQKSSILTKQVQQLQYYAQYLIIAVDLKYYLQFYEQQNNKNYIKACNLQQKYNELVQFYSQ